jgi:DNA-directed RNA polymerase subunit RPC12/RpoP
MANKARVLVRMVGDTCMQCGSQVFVQVFSKMEGPIRAADGQLEVDCPKCSAKVKMTVYAGETPSCEPIVAKSGADAVFAFDGLVRR